MAGLRAMSPLVWSAPIRRHAGEGYGSLVPDPAGVLDLPSGFSYQIFSRFDQTMDDGLLVPPKHDGMAAFPGPDGLTLLVRNHEVELYHPGHGPFGKHNKLIKNIDPAMIYDVGRGTTPSRGGTTTLVYDTRAGRLVRHFMSLAGTERNCAGGPTPWGTWLSCEETVDRAGPRHERDHGWVFEVPARAEPGLTRPEPITAMGRFNHEAVAVDPKSGVVYLTEDRLDCAVYRFIPRRPGRLLEGGRLQALRIVGRRSLDTRNWRRSIHIDVGEQLRVEWIDLEGVQSPDDTLRYQAVRKGAGVFARGEGMWFGRGNVYFACTEGGSKRKGQIWRYQPSRFEGTKREQSEPGVLELFVEPDDATIVENADNLTVSPWGDLIVCEDGPGEQHLLGVTPEGHVYTFARNARSASEFAGATFAPDGSMLFVNLQDDGFTLAIRGPWKRA